MSFKFCSECLLRVIAGYYPAKWAVCALPITSHARCRCGQWAEFETEPIG